VIIPTFIKWAGGKRRLIEQIDPYIPKKINNYYEPFLGGASMFFYIKQKYNPKHCVLSDINKDLIETFKIVRDNPQQLIKKLKYFKKKHSKEFFYETREKFNRNKLTGIRRNAAFIYLNKNCFNGLYRVNSKNEFNVPYGHYKNNEIFNEETILFASKLLKGTDIICQDYENLKESVEKGDFVYLDPCYDPLKKTSFANYTKDRFSEKDNERLALFCAELNMRCVKILLSNNITPNVTRNYLPKEGFILIKILAPRSINSIGSQRGKIQEYLIRNFKIQNAIQN
jgi:DNA adenine methylase